MGRKRRLYILLCIFAVLTFQYSVLHSQTAVEISDCDRAVVRFDNPDEENVEVKLITKSTDTTLVFSEDFSRMPNVQSGAMMCNAAVMLALPASYTSHSGCRARRIYSPNGDTCYFNYDGEFSTPLIDLSACKDSVRISFDLKTVSSYSCTFSMTVFDSLGNQIAMMQLPMTTNSETHFDSLFVFDQNKIFLHFSTTNFVAFDNLAVSAEPLTTTIEQTISTTADSCEFTALKSSAKYYCTISSYEDTIEFRTPKALELGNITSISPYEADFSFTACGNLSSAQYVLKTISTPTTVFATDLFISEVASTNASNRAIEIYNGTGMAVCLQDYRLVTDINTGSGNYTTTISLGFTVADSLQNDSCLVVMQSLQAMNSGDRGVYYVNPSVFGQIVIDGNDPIALLHGNDTIDIFGNFGEHPTNQQGWTSENMRTAKIVLQRLGWVTKGVNTNASEGFPTLSSQWQQLGNVSSAAAENFSGFGWHTMDGALYAENPDSVISALDISSQSLHLTDLQPNTIYEIFLLAEQSGEQIRSNTVRFKTGRHTKRTESGTWFDNNWTCGIPDTTCIAEVANHQTLTVPDEMQAKCYSLVLRDTLGHNRPLVYESGNLLCLNGVSVELFFDKPSQDSVSYSLLSLPVGLDEQDIAATLQAVFSNPAFEPLCFEEQFSPEPFVSYPMKISDTATLVFSGNLNSDASYTLTQNNTSGLCNSNFPTLLSQNPYPFPICVNQILRDRSCLPQRLDTKTGVFVPLCENDTLQAYEGILVELIDENSLAIATRTSLTPIPPHQEDLLVVSLQTSDLSDKTQIVFSQDYAEGFDPLRDNHKFSLEQDALQVALLHQAEPYSFKSLPPFADSLSLELDLQLPSLAAYSLKVSGNITDSCLAATLTDIQSGEVLFDYVTDSIYTFQSPKGSKHFSLNLYKTLASSDKLPDECNIRLIKQDNTLKVQSRCVIEQLVLYDMQGRELIKTRGNDHINLPNKGTFILKVQTSSQTLFFKSVNVD